MNVPGQPLSLRPHVGPLATHLLSLQYRATIVLATLQRARYPVLPGANRLFLTLLGGGAFENDPSWIGAALQDSLPLLRASGLEVQK